MKKRLVIVLMILSMLLISCTGKQVSEPTPTNTPTATPTPAAEPSPTETPTEAPVPSDTPAPSATPKPTSTVAGASPTPETPTVPAPEATVIPTAPTQPTPPPPTAPAQPPPPAPPVVPAQTGDIDALVQALVGGSDDERRASVEGLIAMGPAAQQAIPQLVQALANQDPAVQTAIAEVLGAQPPEVIVPQLVQALSGGDPQVITAIAQQLGSLGPQATPSIEPLIQAMAGANEQTGAVLAQALTSITGQNFGTDTAAWEQWWAAQQVVLPEGGPLDFQTPTRIDSYVSTNGGHRATIIVQISGGVGPFTVHHDLDMGLTADRTVSIEFDASGCGLIVHGIKVESADGQSVSHDYALQPPWCD